MPDLAMQIAYLGRYAHMQPSEVLALDETLRAQVYSAVSEIIRRENGEEVGGTALERIARQISKGIESRPSA